MKQHNNKFTKQQTKEQQIRDAIIQHTEGPMQVIAGPGTGKTSVLIDRTTYLIQGKNVSPSAIMLVTYTRKAARELLTRLTEKLRGEHDLSGMYIGTFHHICSMLLQEYGDRSFFNASPDIESRSGFTDNQEQQSSKRFLDEFEQQYQIYKNLWSGKKLTEAFHPYDEDNSLFWRPIYWDSIQYLHNCWKLAGDVKNCLNQLARENLLDALDDWQEPASEKRTGNTVAVRKLSDEERRITMLQALTRKYNELKEEEQFSDYEDLIRNAAHLMDDQKTRRKIAGTIQYIMVDEYQDVNAGMEDFLLKLGKEIHNNICIFGDDDQSLYEFRGGNVRFLLNFPKHFPKGMCKEFRLDINHRSTPSIVEFCNEWMKDDDLSENKYGEAHWEDKWRLPKIIRPDISQNTVPEATAEGSVFFLSANTEEDWKEKIVSFISKYGNSMGKTVGNHNQIAFLCNSVNDHLVRELCNKLEEIGIPVYNPRGNLFFERKEIKLLIACLLNLFPVIKDEITDNIPHCLQKSADNIGICYDSCRENCLAERQTYYDYCSNCLQELESSFNEKKYAELQNWLQDRATHETFLEEHNRFLLLSYIYQFFSFEPFKSWLAQAEFDEDRQEDYRKFRAARNLSIFTKLVKNFELFNPIKEANPSVEQKRSLLQEFFRDYLRLQKEVGIYEYEYDNAPENCVSLMTIHQAKGLEFPVTIVFPNSKDPDKQYDPNNSKKRKQVCNAVRAIPRQETVEKLPNDSPDFTRQQYYNYRRLYYTAFSRAKSLLLITNIANDAHAEFSFNPFIQKKAYNKIQEQITDINDFYKNELKIKISKTVPLIQTYSFTTHKLLYEKCPLLYKFIKILDFSTEPPAQTMTGKLVHTLMEGINRAAIDAKNRPSNVQALINKDIIDDAYSMIQKAYNLYQEEPDETHEHKKEEVLLALQHYIDQRDSENTWQNIAACEESLFMPVNKDLINQYFSKAVPAGQKEFDPYYIKGILDLIETKDSKLQIMDFKHTNLPDIPEASPEITNYRQQQQLYCMLMQAADSYKGKQISAAGLYFTKEEEPKHRYFSLPLEADEIRKTFTEFHAIVTKIQKKEFPKGGASDYDIKCEACPFFSYCWE